MYGFIFGFQRLARWPKCTPESIRSLTTSDTNHPPSCEHGFRPSPAGRPARGGLAEVLNAPGLSARVSNLSTARPGVKLIRPVASSRGPHAPGGRPATGSGP